MTYSNFKLSYNPHIKSITPQSWNHLFNQTENPTPFTAHEFLLSLEETGCVGAGKGWQPHHLTVYNEQNELITAAPGYKKTNSLGEYIFDHLLANLSFITGKNYYPKYIFAAPFTPVPGTRLAISTSHQKDTKFINWLTGELKKHCAANGLSSLHVNFEQEAMVDRLTAQGFLKRTGLQYHWYNKNYSSFDDFLARLTSRKRKQIKKERKSVETAGLTIKWLKGDEIKPQHWDHFFDFYIDTGSRKWGTPYLNRAFFEQLGHELKDKCLLCFAYQDNIPLAGALHLMDQNGFYGRYWGMKEFIPALHFELCYYRAIDYAIAHNIPVVQAGAQGEHKLLRGYEPTSIFSAHWFSAPNLHIAANNYFAEETKQLRLFQEKQQAQLPFKASTD